MKQKNNRVIVLLCSLRWPPTAAAVQPLLMCMLLWSACTADDGSSSHATQEASAEKLLEQAIHLRQQAYYDSALVQLSDAMQIFYGRSDTTGIIEGLVEAARVASIRGHHGTANDSLDRARFFLSRARRTLAALDIEVDVARARNLVRMGRPADAIDLLARYPASIEHRGIHAARGFALYELDEPERAIAVLSEGLRQASDGTTDDLVLKSRITNNLALSWHSYRRDFLRARHFLEETERLRRVVLRPDHPQLAEVAGNLGMLLMHAGLYQEARSYLQTAADVFRKGGEDSEVNLAVSYSNLGILNNETGEHDLAVAFLNRSLEIRRRRLGEDHPRLYFTYSRLARAYHSLGNARDALRFSRLSLRTSRRLDSRNSVRLAVAYADIADAFFGAGVRDSSRYYYRRALLEAKEIQNKGITADILHRIAEMYMYEANWTVARDYLERAEAKLRGVFMPDEVLKLKIFNDLAQVFFALGRRDKAVDLVSIALRYNSSTSARVLLGHELTSPLSAREYLRSIVIRARAIATECQSRPESPLCSPTILASDVRLVSRFLRLTRTASRSTDSRRFISSAREAELSELVEVIGRTTSMDSTRHLARSLYGLIEATKAALLVDHLADGGTHVWTPAFASRRHEVVVLEQQALSARSEEERLTLRRRIADLRIEYDQLLRRIEEDHPTYYAIKYGDELIDADAAAQDIDEDEALVEFYFGRDSLYTFTITRSSWRFTSTAREPVDQSAKSLVRSLTEQDYHTYVQEAQRLYKLTLESSRDLLKGKHLIIIPDGSLHRVPFETLLDREPRATSTLSEFSYSTLPYLIKTNSISYSYSATLRSILKRREPTNTEGRFLGIAPFNDRPVVRSSTMAAPLPGSGFEVSALHDLFSPPYKPLSRVLERRSVVALGNDATEKVIETMDLSQFRYIHIATHGVVNDSIPELSGLMFYPSSDGNDGILHLGEIHALNIRADLVVLSACDTGKGAHLAGEGVVGLTGSFLYAGARNVVVSLWQIDDVVTGEFMIPFYVDFLRRQDYRRSLRLSKLRMIEAGGKKSRPFYWAPFILFDS